MTNIDTYKKAIEYIFSLSSPLKIKDAGGESKPGVHIEHIRRFLQNVENPQNSYPTIHIGGTAGKGSTCHFVANILAEMGLKVGLHTSPNLVSLNEKFQIAEKNFKGIVEIKNCKNESMVELTNWFEENREKYILDDNHSLTFYEAITAMVFKYFENEKVDVGVVEVAMGGKLDATNVINSDVQILNSVGLDHTKFLGDTLEEITNDKMQIMKPNKIFVSGLDSNDPQNEKLNKMIIEHAEKLGAKLKILGKDFNYEITESGIEGSEFNLIDELGTNEYELTAIGDFQPHNATLAIEAVKEFAKINPNLFDKRLIGNYELSTKYYEKSLRNTQIKGRFDIIQKDPLVIFDGAHNEIKMQKFCQSLLKYLPKLNKDGIDLLFSCTNTKDLEKIIAQMEILSSNGNTEIKKIYITQFTKKYYTDINSYTNEEMVNAFKDIFGADIQIETFTDPVEAYKIFKDNLKENRVGVVTGSLYLLGKLYENIE